MKKTAAAFLLVFACAFWTGAQEKAPEVGVVDRSGGYIDLQARLTDEDGRQVTLKDYLDKPVILTLNYFRCAGICTPLLRSLHETVQEVRGLELGKDYRIVTVSFDETDTFELARQKRDNFLGNFKTPVPSESWHFLTGSAADSRAVCDSAGFYFKKEADQFVHAGVLVILSKEGRIVKYIYGTSFLPAEVEAAVREAATDTVTPSIKKFLPFCFNYDPKGRTYLFSFNRLMATIMIIGAVVFVIVLSRMRRKRSAEG